MRLPASLCLALALGLTGRALAGEAIQYGPPPAWVKPLPIPERPPNPANGAFDMLLVDAESYYGPDGDEHYEETAYRVLTAQGLMGAGTIARIWDPATETLTVHKTEIIRDGKAIDALAGGDRYLSLRQEQNLSMAMLDGRLTATKQLAGLQVGDIVHVAMSLKHKDRALAGHSEAIRLTLLPSSVDRLRFRDLWPAERKLRWRAAGAFDKPTLSKTPDGTELVVDRRDFKTPTPPADAPARFNEQAVIELSDFADWRDLSRLFMPLYAGAATLAADSPVKAEAAKIRQAHAKPAERAWAALQLVQQQVRYLYLSVGDGGYVPTSADLTWSRRFGDCKGKTALLLALLGELGIKAEAVLVDAGGGDGMNAHLPRVGLFDHVLVRAEIDGKRYWMDGARIGDRSLADLPPPTSEWALPLTAAGSALEKVEIVAPTLPLLEWALDIDASKGLEGDAPAKLQLLMRGEGAIAFQQQAEAAPRDQMEQALIKAWGEAADATFDKASFGFDAAEGAMKVVLEGKKKLEWRYDRDLRAKVLTVKSSGYTTEFDKRDAGPQADAPYVIGFPFFTSYRTRVKLPDKGAGFELVGADVDQTLSGMAVKRASRIADGQAVIDLSIKTVTDEVSAKEALAAGDAFDKLPTARFVLLRAPRETADVSVPGGAKPQADAKGKTKPKAAPKDAKGYLDLARQMSAEGRHQEMLEAAQGAIGLEPENVVAYAARGYAYSRLGKLELALADFDRAIALDPKYSPALIARAEVRFRQKRFDLARDDLDAAARLAPDSPELAGLRAFAANAAGASVEDTRNELIKSLDAQIAAQPDQAYLYLRRASGRAENGPVELALADFDKAIALQATAGAYFGRGWLHWRRNQDREKAIADFDAAIRLGPAPENYEERGRFRLALKDYDGADSDFAEAARLDPKRMSAQLNRVAVVSLRGDNAKAIGMLDELVKANPSSFEVIRQRGRMHGQAKDYAKALSDFETAQKLAGGNADRELGILFDVARANESLERYEAALAAYDALLAKWPAQAGALNNRCWLKAVHKLKLETALADCDASLKMTPKNAASLDSRGFVLLRLGRYPEAVQAYDAALAIREKSAESLFGRGVAKRRAGDLKGGDADIAAAKAISEAVVKQYAEWGVAP